MGSLRILLLCLVCTVTHTAAQAQQKSKVAKFFGKIGEWIDRTSYEGIDTLYIGVPRRPWQVVVDGSVTQSDLHMKSQYDGSEMYEGVVGTITAEPRICTAVTTSAGFWVAYRGYGIGYSVGVAGDEGSDWDFELSGTNFYAKLRLHNFEGGTFNTRLSGSLANPDDPSLPPEPFSFSQPLVLSSPMKIKTLLFEGVYIFNGKHFSYAAAYDQSFIQRRSAGSFIAGLRYFQSDYNYAHNSNADLILNMNDIGRIKTWQGSIGAGYTYNWVPFKGFLVNVMAMPMLTVLNRIKTYTYDSNYRQMALDEELHSDDELPRDDYRITPMDTDGQWSRVTLNFNCRASITYNWTRCYLNAIGNFYNSRYHYSANSGWLNDWSATLNLGVRF